MPFGSARNCRTVMSAVMTTWQSQRTYLCNCDWDLSTNDAGMYGRSHVHSPRKAMNQLLTCPVPTPLCGTADGVVPGLSKSTHVHTHHFQNREYAMTTMLTSNRATITDVEAVRTILDRYHYPLTIDVVADGEAGAGTIKIHGKDTWAYALSVDDVQAQSTFKN